MWIYKKTEKGASLINTDHVSRVYINDSSVYADIVGGDIEKVVGLSSEKTAERFMVWLTRKIHNYNAHVEGQVIFACRRGEFDGEGD